MNQLIDLERYPLDQEGSPAWTALVDRARADLVAYGMFNLEGFLRPGVAGQAMAEIAPVMETASFEHKRLHNIYFQPSIAGLAPDHPALHQVETANRTVCADQIPHSLVTQVYAYPPLVRFLAAAMEKPSLFTMADPLARVNVMSYRAGETLNWHFDRSEFTTTLLLQAPLGGGDFEYRTDLRSPTDLNYAGVAKLLTGQDPLLQRMNLQAGTLNVFRGKNTAHRVTKVEGAVARMIAVFSYFETPGVVFTPQEQQGFYGRVATR